MLKHDLPYDTIGTLTSLFSAAPVSDISKLAALIGHFPRSSSLIYAADKMLSAFAGRAPGECFEFVMKTDLPLQTEGVSAALLALAEADPMRFKNSLEELSRKDWAKLSLPHFFESLAKSDPGKAWETASQMKPDRLRRVYQGSVINAIVATNPERAAALATSLEPGQRIPAQTQVFEAWAKQSPTAALAWLEANLHGAGKHQVISYALCGLGADIPPEFYPLVDELPSKPLRNLALQNVVPPLPKEMPAELAFQKTAAWGAPQFARVAMVRHAESMADQDLPAALNFIHDARFPEASRNEALARVANSSGDLKGSLTERVIAVSGDQAPAVASRILSLRAGQLSLSEENSLREISRKAAKP